MKNSVEVLEDKTGEISQKVEQKKIKKWKRGGKNSESYSISSQVQLSNKRSSQETGQRK